MKVHRFYVLAAMLAAAIPLAAGDPVVTTAPVIEVTTASARRYAGVVEAVQKVDIMPRVTGVLLKIHFKEGEIVQQGDLLFELEDTTYKAAVEALEARREQLIAQVDFMTKEFNRNRDLLTNKAVAQSVYDRSLFDLNSARAQLKEVEAALIDARNNLSYTRIHAPITGRIGKSTFTVGNLITPGGQPLASIEMVSPIYVRFAISETVMRREFGGRDGILARGSIKIKLADDNIYGETARITLVDNHINQRTNTIALWAEFRNNDHQLIPGGYVTVELHTASETGFTAVLPSAVVISENGECCVFVVDGNNQISRRVVTTGGTSGEYQIIRSGLRRGEIVVVEGSHKIQPGMTVECVPAQ
ncbi:MAG: efflux RND transporter periplasmic adaptor subunit [Lentisphaerae bacterium]|nr:efflux RND transporter periplasmic adaptor subunit [Lentisphaerota bacterium]